MKKIIRVGGYARVSTEEQKKFGFSIDAQVDKIKTYCDLKEYQLIDIYIDEGFSASNMKRPRLTDLLNNLDNIDAVVFTKLDRLSRSVYEANKMLDILSRKGVSMISIDEDDINVTDADSLFLFQLKASLAEREIKKTSERIRSVFNYKVKEGQVISGNLPYGYTTTVVDNKKVADYDPDTRHIVEDTFKYFAKHHSIRQTLLYINKKYDLERSYSSYKRLLKNEYYYGRFRDNLNYFPPYITYETYLKNQRIIDNNIRVRSNNHVYLFSGLIRCPECSNSFVGYQAGGKRRLSTYNYRCNSAMFSNGTRCNFKKSLSEYKIEAFLLDNLEDLMRQYMLSFSKLDKKKNNSKKRYKEIKKELENLNYMFRKGRISASTYDLEFETLEKELKRLDFVEETTIPQLSNNWNKLYHTLDKVNKRAFWRSVIKEIEIDKDKNISVIFV